MTPIPIVPLPVACAEEAERQLNESGDGLAGGKGSKRRRLDDGSPIAEVSGLHQNYPEGLEDGEGTLVIDEDDSIEDGYK